MNPFFMKESVLLIEDEQIVNSFTFSKIHQPYIRFALVIYLLFTSTFLLNGQVSADTMKYWKVHGKSSLNFSQVSLTNWSEGGDGSVSGAFLFDIMANKNLKFKNHD